MVDKKRLDMVHAGDPYIPAETLNGAIRVANQWDATGLDWDTVEHFFDDGITRQVTNVIHSPTDPDYEFKTIKDSINTVSVQWGMWVRNGYPANTVGEITTTTVLDVVPDGTDQYVVATLASDTYHDPALIPDTELTLSIKADEPEDDQYDKQMVIARINTTGGTISDVFQIRRGGRKEDAVVRCDGDTYSAVAPLRRTLEMNPVVGADPENPFEETHKDELQLYNVDTCFKNSFSFPYFDSDTPEIIAGTLKWACPDSHLENNVEESIQISTNAAGYSIVQIYGFRTASTIAVPSIESGDLVMFKNISSSSVDYISFSNLMEYIEAEFNMSTICEWIELHCDIGSWGIQNHYDLVDIVPGTYTKHDHKNYWQNGQSTAGRVGTPSTNYAVNYGTSIGDSDAKKVIDMDTCTLHVPDGSNDVCVDWDDRVLFDRRGFYNITVVNWGAQYLKNDIDQVVLDWANKALEDDGTKCLTWDSTSVDIVEGRIFNVLTTTAAGDDLGAIKVVGGGYFEKGLYVKADTDSPAGYFENDIQDNKAYISNDDWGLDTTGSVNVANAYSVLTTQVVGPQGEAVADATGAGDVVAQLNALLARVRAHGLIAT